MPEHPAEEEGVYMEYGQIKEGIFRERPNRFLAWVEVDGCRELCHVKNTGRCRELLIPGVRVILECHPPGKRKTRFSLVAVEKQGRLVNMDSQAPNQAAEERLRTSPLGWPVSKIQREVFLEGSRLDFYLEGTEGQKAYLEVKGVTLEENGVARFPDAPTERGVRHLGHLIRAKEAGYEAYLLLVIQMKGVYVWEPNWETHAAFGEAVRQAAAAGVEILARDCRVWPGGMEVDAPVPCRF